MSSTDHTTSPQSLYVTAKGYLQSALLLMEGRARSPQGDGVLFLSIHLLLGFAVERYLKAYLRLNGKTDDELKRIGHKLDKAYTQACALGFPQSTPTEELIGYLEEDHGDFTYRYLPASWTFNEKNKAPSVANLIALDIEVDRAVGASASHGLSPGQTWKTPAN